MTIVTMDMAVTRETSPSDTRSQLLASTLTHIDCIAELYYRRKSVVPQCIEVEQDQLYLLSNDVNILYANPDGVGMLKHVAVSPHRARADSVSLSSSASCCSLGSLENRHDSVTDLSQRTTTIKVYARRLRPDIEYKTLSVTWGTRAREVVATLLSKFRMRHRDPRLFYLSMEVRVRAAGLRTTLVLDDDARPAALQACHPKGYSKFSLQMRPGGLVKIYDSALMSSSQYKCLLTSERTTADELLAILLHCYDSTEGVERFSLYEVSPSQEYERKLHPDDLPLLVQRAWPPDSDCHFRVRRNPRAPPLPPRTLAPATPADEPEEEPSRALSALSLESDEGKRRYSPVYKFPSISYCRESKNDYLYI